MPTMSTPITNVAYLDDGLGHVILLESDSTYYPGYGLTINDGDLYTNIPTVTLRYSWHPDDNITHVKFSNSSDFSPGDGTTDWIPVIPPEYTWLLDVSGESNMPHTVYAKFRDAGENEYGFVYDQISYNSSPPQVLHVEIVTQTLRGLTTQMPWDVTVRVTAIDADDGVDKVQFSNSTIFLNPVEYAATSGQTDVAWSLQPSGIVYARVLDRAGNASPAKSGQGPTHKAIYLPLVLRAYVGPEN